MDVLNDNQKLAYVLECPICLHKIITSDNNLDYCPQCENIQFPLDLVALINTDQMEELAIDNKDVTTLVIVKDGEIKLIDKLNKNYIWMKEVKYIYENKDVSMSKVQ